MKRITDFIFSTKVSIVLLLIFAFAIGLATFVEDKYDTITAKILIYNALWFEVLLILLALNFIGNIRKYKLFSKEKAGGFIFHLAFIICILGAGVTRYIGTEGMMHIREGQSSNIIYSTEAYMTLSSNDNKTEIKEEKPLYISEYLDNSFHMSMNIENKGKLNVTLKEYIKNPVEKIEENVNGGGTIIQLGVEGKMGLEPIFISEGDYKNIGSTTIAYKYKNPAAIQLTEKNGIVYFTAPYNVKRSSMQGTETDTIPKDSLIELKSNLLYTTNDAMFVYTKYLKNAKKVLVKGNPENKGMDALILNVELNGKTQDVTIFGGQGYSPKYEEVTIDGATFKIGYGDKETILPFSIQLNDFILDRYAGSMSPSSYASEVTLIDPRNNLKENHRIFMNNVLDYNMYRFFQSSYELDEKGTILSVNHDFFGTWISYIGYILLGVGFILTLLNKNSRFAALGRLIRGIREKRKASMMTILLVLGLSSMGFSQTAPLKVVSEDHAEAFGHVIVQSFDGRFEPAHSLAVDVIHKISRKDNFNLEGKGKMNAAQVFLDMMIDPEYWKQQKIFYIREKSVREAIGITTDAASFVDFFDNQQKYKLAEYGEAAFRKKGADQNKFDKEIIKVEERVNVFFSAIQGNLLKIFPIEGSKNNKWITWNDTLAFAPLSGIVKVINEDLQLKDLNYNNIMRSYLINVVQGTQSGDYTKANKILEYIESIQRNYTPENILPSKSKINTEIHYNKSQIFINLKNWYGILSLILLVLAFLDNFRAKKSKTISILQNIFIVLLGAGFLYHTYGMGLRWYLTGHAPWSNGYEALILVAWGGLLAGFCFMRYSKITLAATAVLAFSILMTAGHSSYDPQLTNLQPVLKSFWLIIHVASITISYGFLGLGFVLGLINMFLYLFKNKNNAGRLDLAIQELTYINEMNLTIGLILATLGTFLGGVWANESWGIYWGWDAKETWALAIMICYAMILHFRLIPKLKGHFIFNVGSILGFGSVIMTFVGVNYYLSKGMHSYAADDTPVFPIWAWLMIFSIILLMVVAGIKERMLKKE